MKTLEIPTQGNAETCGIVTLNAWTMMPNGQTYLYLWAESMAVLMDAQRQ